MADRRARRLFKLAVGSFLAWGLIFIIFCSQARKWLTATLELLFWLPIWPWIGREVVFTYRVDFKLRS